MEVDTLNWGVFSEFSCESCASFQLAAYVKVIFLFFIFTELFV